MIEFVFKILFFITAVFVLVYLFFYSANILLAPVSEKELQNQACYKEHCFSVKLARTNQECCLFLTKKKYILFG